MYNQILEEIKKIGNEIHQYAWQVLDIWQAKQRLTEHDIATERRLCDFIKILDQDAAFFAEEENDQLSHNTKSIWIIDPISNTFNFIHGLPHYTICISHMVDEIIHFAAVYDPSTQELFSAEKWKWSYLNWKKISVSQKTSDLWIIIWPHLVPKNPKNSELINIITTFSELGTIRIIWSLWIHYAYVACGRIEAAISLSKDIFPEMAWKLLVEEAWGKFTDFDNQDIWFETRKIIASNWLIHNTILENL